MDKLQVLRGSYDHLLCQRDHQYQHVFEEQGLYKGS